jgi:hypothetical protein
MAITGPEKRALPLSQPEVSHEERNNLLAVIQFPKYPQLTSVVSVIEMHQIEC